MASSEHSSDSSSSIVNKLSVEAGNEKPKDKSSEEVRQDMTELSGTGQLDKGTINALIKILVMLNSDFWT